MGLRRGWTRGGGQGGHSTSGWHGAAQAWVSIKRGKLVADGDWNGFRWGLEWVQMGTGMGSGGDWNGLRWGLECDQMGTGMGSDGSVKGGTARGEG